MDLQGRAFSLGRSFFGLAVLASGVLQLVIGDFVRLVAQLPSWLPAHSVLAYLCGALLVVAGLAILSDRMARPASAIVAGGILAQLVFLYPPSMFANPQIDRPLLRGFMYTNPLKCLALVGGAAILVGRSRDMSRALESLVRAIGKLEPWGATFLAAFLFVCGFQHFWYADFVVTMVPAWIPPGQRFWTYFTGAALMAGGTGILVRPTARLAATLSALMIFMWVFLVHIPRAFAGPDHANETAGIFEALALSGVALMVGATRPRP